MYTYFLCGREKQLDHYTMMNVAFSGLHLSVAGQLWHWCGWQRDHCPVERDALKATFTWRVLWCMIMAEMPWWQSALVEWELLFSLFSSSIQLSMIFDTCMVSPECMLQLVWEKSQLNHSWRSEVDDLRPATLLLWKRVTRRWARNDARQTLVTCIQSRDDCTKNGYELWLPAFYPRSWIHSPYCRRSRDR